MGVAAIHGPSTAGNGVGNRSVRRCWCGERSRGRSARRWTMVPIAATDGLIVLFERYNPAIWPAQLVAYLLGLAAVALVFARPRRADRAIGAILAACWLWVGVVFLGIFARQIAPVVAVVEGAIVAAQGVFFL